MTSPSKTKPGKPYAHHYPEVWAKAVDATTSLFALQALLMKPLEKVNEDQVEGLIDAAVTKLLQVKHLIDFKLIANQNDRPTH